MMANGRIRPLWPVLISVLLALFATGCSNSAENSGLSLVDEQGNHPAGWISAHPGFALPDGSVCLSCHGSVTSAAESGGISGVSCFLASRNGQGCHANGPSFTGVHGVPFRTAEHFLATDNSFASVCSNCHAIAPPDTSPLATAPLCRTCHTAGSPLTFLDCSSCHSDPPGGVAYPNIAGAHPTHDNVTGVTGVCDSCHNGLGSGTLAHYNSANARPGKDALRVPPGDVAFLSDFNAKSGPGSFDNVALTCTNVSCHGGQTTPNWQTGSINPDTDCESCHVFGTTQFNSYFSGRHFIHVEFFVPVFGVVPTCVACHDTVKLADPAVGAHFDNLVTTTVEVRGSETIGQAFSGGTFIQSYIPDPVSRTGSCTPDQSSGCHTLSPVTQNW